MREGCLFYDFNNCQTNFEKSETNIVESLEKNMSFLGFGQ